MEPSSGHQRSPQLIVLAAIIAASGLGLATMDRWLPLVQQMFSGSASTSDGHDDHDDHESTDRNVLRLSRQARETLGIQVERLTRVDYDRSVRIPGQVVKIPGVTDREVTAKSSGTIQQIYVLEGQVVGPSDPLITIQLTHEDAINVQLKLLEALATMEVVHAEIERLEQLERSSPGAVAGKRLLEQRYQLGQLEHTVASHHQALLLLGLPEKEVAALSRRHHRLHNESDAGVDEQYDKRSPLVDQVTIYAPPAEEQPLVAAPTFLVENLAVNPGQHVNIGHLLCRLVDYRRLYIEGRAFERDLVLVRRAMQQQWTVDIAVEQRDESTELHKALKILYVDPEIDAESRSARFYVELINTPRAQQEHQGRPYADWQFRPGQRVELRVPIERFEQALVVPVEAIAREGLENYVFQVSGNIFVRRPVTVRYRDDKVAVLSDEDDILEGASLATSGAYQLQLSLLNRSSGPVEHSHGGGAHAH